MPPCFGVSSAAAGAMAMTEAMAMASAAAHGPERMTDASRLAFLINDKTQASQMAAQVSSSTASGISLPGLAGRLVKVGAGATFAVPRMAPHNSGSGFP